VTNVQEPMRGSAAHSGRAKNSASNTSLRISPPQSPANHACRLADYGRDISILTTVSRPRFLSLCQTWQKNPRSGRHTLASGASLGNRFNPARPARVSGRKVLLLFPEVAGDNMQTARGALLYHTNCLRPGRPSSGPHQAFVIALQKKCRRHFEIGFCPPGPELVKGRISISLNQNDLYANFLAGNYVPPVHNRSIRVETMNSVSVSVRSILHSRTFAAQKKSSSKTVKL
jgi:hypothetical protein